MLQNAYLVAKIGADTAENEQHLAEILPITGNYPTVRTGGLKVVLPVVLAPSSARLALDDTTSIIDDKSTIRFFATFFYRATLRLLFQNYMKTYEMLRKFNYSSLKASQHHSEQNY